MNALRYLMFAGMLLIVPTLVADEPARQRIATKDMSLTGSPELRPAFRYRLWAEPVMRTAGNAAVVYPRAFSPEFVAGRANWPKDERLDALHGDAARGAEGHRRDARRRGASQQIALRLGSRRTHARCRLGALGSYSR